MLEWVRLYRCWCNVVRFRVSPCFWAPGSCPGALSLVVCVLGWYLLRSRWVPCWSAIAALVAGGVV